MMHYTDYSNTEQLETIRDENKSNFLNNKQLLTRVKKGWRQLIKAWAKGNEPRVWQSRDRSGQIRWHGYDPVTGYSVQRTSQAEMRLWLEECYIVLR